jgi:Transposase DDE domain
MTTRRLTSRSISTCAASKSSYPSANAIISLEDIPQGWATGTKVIHVADRECDIYEFLREAKDCHQCYVIRACYDRAVESAEYVRVQDQLKATGPQARIEFEVPSEKRKAELDLTFAPVTLKAPGRVAEVERIAIPCWVVHVIEPKPPNGNEALTWTLLTNVAVTSVEDALERLSWYRRRWSIEEFHKILKSGCTVEDCRLQTAARLKRYIALFCVIAWRIFWMVHIQRADPKAPAAVVLTKTEIGTLCSLNRFKDKCLSVTTMTVKHAVIATACLGGYIDRKNDPPPGPTALWRGWQRLSSMAELYETWLLLDVGNSEPSTGPFDWAPVGTAPCPIHSSGYRSRG